VQPSDHLGARRVGEAGQLVEMLVEVRGVGGSLAGGAHQEGAFGRGMDLDQGADAAASRGRDA